MTKREGLSGTIDRNGKGDKRRPQDVNDQIFSENGTKTFGEDWAIPPVLRRRKRIGYKQDDAC